MQSEIVCRHSEASHAAIQFACEENDGMVYTRKPNRPSIPFKFESVELNLYYAEVVTSENSIS